MTPLLTYQSIQGVLASTAGIGLVLQAAIAVFAGVLFVCAILPSLDRWRGLALGAMTLLLLAGEGVLIWLHWRLWQLAAVVDPATGRTVANVAVSLWVESEKLYVWALIVALFGVFMRRQRQELLPGVMLAVAVLSAGAVLIGQPFTNPLPGFLGQYYGYLQATEMGGVAAQQAFEGMASAATYYYNAWFMWVHPPLLFIAYGAFTISFVATVQMIATTARVLRDHRVPLGAPRLPAHHRGNAARTAVGADVVAGRGVVVVGQGQHVDHDVDALHRLPARTALPAAEATCGRPWPRSPCFRS